jgi:hypothetical protein
MKQLLTSNSKLKKDGIVSFDLPSQTTCPFALHCKQGCYARRLEIAFPSKLAKSLRAFDATKLASFVPDMVKTLSRHKASIVRIHGNL